MLFNYRITYNSSISKNPIVNLFNEIKTKINKNQKNLQRFLFSKYKVNISGKPVNRAWLKIYELFHNTNFFNNIKSKGYSFFIETSFLNWNILKL